MKVHLRMVGCRLNQSEIDTMARQFRALGHEIVDSPDEADHFVLNTCAVTNEATKTSRKLIRDFHRLNPAGETTVTGCYAQIAPRDIRRLPGVRRVVDNDKKSQLVSQITGEWIDIYDSEPLERQPALGRTRAFVKVQDGWRQRLHLLRNDYRARRWAESIDRRRGARSQLSAPGRSSGSGVDRRAPGKLRLRPW